MINIDHLKCYLCAGSPDIELYTIELSDQEKEFLQRNGSNLLKVDICIGKEIEGLIKNKIRTRGCCCGHGEYRPTCLIDKTEKDKLDSLGYEYRDYDDTDMYEVNLKTNIQTELRKVLGYKVFRYLGKQ